MNHTGQARLAVDIGGTFTDTAIAVGDQILTSKTLTTAERPVEGVLQGIDYAIKQTQLEPADFASVIHGTTLASHRHE